MLLRRGIPALPPAGPASLRAHAEAFPVDCWERPEQAPFPQHRRPGRVTLLPGCRSPTSPLPAEPLPGSPRAAPAPPRPAPRGCDAAGAAPRGRGSEIGLGRRRRAARAAEQRGHARPRRAPQPGRRRPRRQGQAHAPRQGHPGR